MGPDITPGYVWCADCHGLGTIDEDDDDFSPTEIDCPRCGGNGEHPEGDHDDFDSDGLDWSEGMG